ncbi:MAG: TIGR01459 family HAD-type hydrolase [Hyphomicrobiaceae bacterium]
MTPPIFKHAGELLPRYDVVLCDVWGVVHDGLKAFPQACEALSRFRAQGGTVVLVSNAPVPQEQVAAMLVSRAVPQTAYDAIVSSGDIALTHVAEKGYSAVYCIGPRDRDAALFDKLPARQTSLAEAEVIVCSGLTDDRTETAESYRNVLETALERGLPFVCANPDLVVDVGGKLYLCAGAIADLYAHMGGEVFWAGKPHASAYGTALDVARRLRQADVPADRILGIGDALRTDLKAAQGAGVDGLFIAGGIHRHDAMTGQEIDPGKLQKLFQGAGIPALAAMAYLRW